MEIHSMTCRTFIYEANGAVLFFKARGDVMFIKSSF